MVKKISSFLIIIAGVSIFCMIIITLLDVIFNKIFHSPINGTYELVAVLQIIAISLACPDTLLKKTHISVEIINSVIKNSKILNFIQLFVQILNIILFVIIGFEAFRYGVSLYNCGEVTGTIKIPLYPFAFTISLGALGTVIIIGKNIFSLVKALK